MIRKTPLKKIWRKRMERIANWESEIVTFEKVIRRVARQTELYPVSELSWISLQCSWEEIPARCFAHLLCKKNYPEYRNNEYNVMLVANAEEHQSLDRVMTIPWVKREVQQMLEAGQNDMIIPYISELFFEQLAESF